MIPSEEQVVYVKREMAERGFYSRDFANLPESQTRGSRELLLSFGWLMCKENIIHRFMNNRTSPLDEELNSHHKVSFVKFMLIQYQSLFRIITIHII